MKLEDTQQDEFKEAAKPLIEFLNTHCHPHCSVIVTTDGAEVVEGFACFRTSEFIRD